MMLRKIGSRLALPVLLALGAACGNDGVPDIKSILGPDTTGTGGTSRTTTGPLLASIGAGVVAERFTAEVWTRGNYSYTTTWGLRGSARGNAVKIWDVSGAKPVLVDSVIVANASTLGDVQTSDDGTLLVVAIESAPNGGLAIYQLDTPTKPRLLVRTTGGDLQYGVHTAEVARVAGKLYAFCAMDPTATTAASLVIMDLTNPSAPVRVSKLDIGMPFIHDVFVRDGLLFTAEWHDGTGIWDIGAQGGSVANPRRLSLTKTVNGSVHNMHWYHDASGSKKYVFVGEEGPGSIGSSSRGDIHVLDISNLSAPVEVAAYNLPNAGVHNFSVDETNGFLYAAYYNGGVRVLDIRGDLGTCSVAERFADGRCNLGLMGREKARFTGVNSAAVYIWGVHYTGGTLYASDMLNGLWKLQASAR